MYALLSSKEKNSTKWSLGLSPLQPKNSVHETAHQKNMTDFEIGIINAAEEGGSDETEVSCCFFHLGQSLYRRIQAEGLPEEYNDPEDIELKISTHMILALAFVPEADAKNAFEELRDNVQENLLTVMNYFEENYVSGRPCIPLTIQKCPVLVSMLFYFNALLLGRGRRAVPPRYRI